MVVLVLSNIMEFKFMLLRDSVLGMIFFAVAFVNAKMVALRKNKYIKFQSLESFICLFLMN